MIGVNKVRAKPKGVRRKSTRWLMQIGAVCWRLGLGVVWAARAIRNLLMELDEFVNLIDGFKHVIGCKRHVFERIMWVFLIVGFLYGTYHTCWIQWVRYETNPTVISLERDYRSWNGTLPGITLCYFGKVNDTKAQIYLMEKFNISTADDEYPLFRTFVDIVANATVGNFGPMEDYEEDERFEEIDFRELALAVHPDMSHLISSFDTSFAVEHKMVFTEMGLCYVINSPIGVLLEQPMLEIAEIGDPLTCNYQKNQCFLKVDILHTAAMITIHSPYEVPGFDSKIHLVKKAVETIRAYKIVEVVSTKEVQGLSIDQRKCAFKQEMVGKNAVVTGNMCIQKCRAETAVELCDCRPFMYPFFEGDECTLSGLICLQRSFWPMQAVRICRCKKSCTEINFMENNFYQRVWSVGDTHFMHKSSFRAELLPQKVRLKRDLMFSFEDFLVSFGGAVSLFLGCTVWKLVNLIYISLGKLIQFTLWTVGSLVRCCYCRKNTPYLP